MEEERHVPGQDEQEGLHEDVEQVVDDAAVEDHLHGRRGVVTTFNTEKAAKEAVKTVLNSYVVTFLSLLGDLEGEGLDPVLYEVLLAKVLDVLVVRPEDETAGALADDGEVHEARLPVERIPQEVEVALEVLVELALQDQGVLLALEHLV